MKWKRGTFRIDANSMCVCVGGEGGGVVVSLHLGGLCDPDVYVDLSFKRNFYVRTTLLINFPRIFLQEYICEFTAPFIGNGFDRVLTSARPT